MQLFDYKGTTYLLVLKTLTATYFFKRKVVLVVLMTILIILNTDYLKLFPAILFNPERAFAALVGIQGASFGRSCLPLLPRGKFPLKDLRYNRG